MIHSSLSNYVRNFDLLREVPQNLREAVIAPSVSLRRASAELVTVCSLKVYSVEAMCEPSFTSCDNPSDGREG